MPNALKYLLTGFGRSYDSSSDNYNATQRQNLAYERQLAEEKAKADKEAQANNARTYSVGQLINGETPLPIDQASRYYAAVGGKVPLPQNQRNSIFTNLDKEGRQLYEDTVKFNEPKKQPKTVISKVGKNYYQHEEGTAVNFDKPADYTETQPTVEYKQPKIEHVAGQTRVTTEKWIDGKLASQEDKWIAPKVAKTEQKGGINYISKDLQKVFNDKFINAKVAKAIYTASVQNKSDSLVDDKKMLLAVNAEQINLVKQSAPKEFKEFYDNVYNTYGKKDPPTITMFTDKFLKNYKAGNFAKKMRNKETGEIVIDPGAEATAYFVNLARAIYGEEPDISSIDNSPNETYEEVGDE